ncbi:MBL fold metallo-hydrolase [Rhizobium rhizogenes]|uniref:MBL fold metallo-hydrolase n=1 Tax=Rhizobium rhizogenes TaxID=359 RepID=UPI002868B4DF|nr:MBL fold metallo-hydrolase [Rhizobium rhizogenes]
MRLSDEHNAELAEWIASKGKTLRKIYLTHAHPDHFFGLAKLLERFPEARAIAMPNVVEAMRVTASTQQLDLVKTFIDSIERLRLRLRKSCISRCSSSTQIELIQVRYGAAPGQRS